MKPYDSFIQFLGPQAEHHMQGFLYPNLTPILPSIFPHRKFMSRPDCGPLCPQYKSLVLH